MSNMKRNTPSPMSPNTVSMPTTTSESMYPYTIARTQQPQDFATYSAVSQVSSFNRPAIADANLHTPISPISSPLLSNKTASMFDRGLDVKLSPTLISPTYDNIFGMDDEDYSPRSYGPMKQKTAYPTLHGNIPNGSLGPDVDAFCPSPPLVPYFGSFGVSAPSRVSQSPSNAQTSSQAQAQSVGQDTSNRKYQSTSLQTAASFRSHQAPILIAPNPLSLRPATKPYAPNVSSLTRSPPSQSTNRGAFSTVPRSPPSQQARSTKKGQKKGETTIHDYQLIMSVPELKAELNELEMLILDLRHKEGMAWKEVAASYSRQHGKKTNTAALQMRRRRMMERLWERSCELGAQSKDTAKWEGICKQFSKYAPARRSSKDIDDRSWPDLNSCAYSAGGNSYHNLQRPRNSSDLTIDSYDQDSYSDCDSTGHSLNDSESGGMLSNMSTTAMDNARNRVSNDPSMQLHLQHHHQQQQRSREQQGQHQHQHQHQQQVHQYHDGLYRQHRQDGWGNL